MIKLYLQKTLVITERIPGAWLVQFKEAGHGLMYQYPESFTNMILTFFGYKPIRMEETHF
jgi:hypothetical protein